MAYPSGPPTVASNVKSESADSRAAPWRTAQAAMTISVAGTVIPRSLLRRARSQATPQTSSSMGSFRTLFESPSTCKTPAEVVEELRIPERQVRSCLKRLHDEGVVVKVPRSRPLKYRSAASIGPLFDKRD